jgi:DNA-binding transcriptional regulator YiaG
MAKLIECDPAHNAELRKLRTQLNLSRQQIADVAGVSKSLVDSWLVPEDSKYFRPMPKKSLRLVQLEIGLERPAFKHLRTAAKKFESEIRGHV